MIIKIHISAKFGADYNKGTPTGTIAVIDRIKGESCRSKIMCRVVNIWSRPTWFDAGWFKFEEFPKNT